MSIISSEGRVSLNGIGIRRIGRQFDYRICVQSLCFARAELGDFCRDNALLVRAEHISVLLNNPLQAEAIAQPVSRPYSRSLAWV